MVNKYNFRKNVLSDASRLRPLLLIAFLAISNIGISQQNRTIAEIQGNGAISPFLGEMVHIPKAVITYIGSSNLIVQSPASADDGDPSTSEALLVSGTIPSWASLGKNLSITGRVSEWSSATLIDGPGLLFTELATNENINQPLLDEELADMDFSSLDDLEALEWMRFEFRKAKVCGPTTGSSNWMHVYFGDSRPRREPGIPAPGINGLPAFDRNLEMFQFLQNSTTLPSLSANSIIEGIGIMVPEEDRFELLGLQYQAEVADVYSPVVPTNADDLSIASANLLRLDKASGSFNLRLPKIVDYLIVGLGQPDIIGVQEVADLSTLQAVANAMNAELGNNEYRAYLEQGNNGTSINSGFLVNNRLEVESARALGRSQTLSLGGSLHDRPPFLLEAKTRTIPQIPIKVINLHLRSLSGIEGSNSNYVRTKRNEQSVSVAQMVQSFKEDNLIVLGDFNAYPFSDGYVDGYHQIQGGESEGAIFSTQAIVSPPLNETTASNASDEIYSFVYIGNTQLIDHILYNELQEMQFAETLFYHGNADAPEDWANDYSRPERASDHDALVSFFNLAHPWGDVPDSPGINRPMVITANPYQLESPLLFYPQMGDYYNVALYDMTGRKIRAWLTDFIDSDDTWSLPLNKQIAQGYYIVEIVGADFRWSSPLLFGF